MTTSEIFLLFFLVFFPIFHFFFVSLCTWHMLPLTVEICGVKAHVRGHQVRKQYKPIIWSVGILEKIILRWRRKGSGLRGFRPNAINKVPNQQNDSLKEDDYDYLKEGRKQKEEKIQKALSRVKSMVQYPEARAQYRRLLNVVEDFRQTKVFVNIWLVSKLFNIWLNDMLIAV